MKPNENTVWFYLKDHQQQGPVGLFELKKLIEQKILTGDTFVWNKDIGSWQMAKSLELFSESIIESTRIHLLPDKFKTESEYLEATYSNGRPVVRTVARLFDLSIFSLFIIPIIAIFFPTFIQNTSSVLIFIFCLISWIIVEPLILSIFGNTIGRAFLNTKIKTVNGEPLTFSTAFKRSIFVSAAGMGFGIPIINMICFLFSYRDLKSRGISTWDHQIGTIILYGKVSFSRLCLASTLPTGLLLTGIYL